MARNRNQVTLTFAGDSRDLSKSFDKVGTGAEQMGRRADAAIDRLDTGFRRGQDSAQKYGRRLDRTGMAADQMDTRMMGLSDGIQGVTDLLRGGEMAPHQYAMALADLGSAAYNTVIPSLKDMGSGARRFGRRLTGSQRSITQAADNIGDLGNRASTASTSMSTMGRSVSRSSSGFRRTAGRIGRVTGAVGGVTAALGVATLAWQAHRRAQQAEQEEAARVTEALEATGGALEGVAREALARRLHAFSQIFGDAAVNVDLATEAIRGGQESWDRYVTSVTGGSGLIHNALQDVGDDYIAGREAIEDVEAATTSYTEQISDLNDELDKALRRNEEWISSTFGTENAEIRARDAVRDLTEHVEEHGAQLGRTTEAGDRQKEMMQELVEAEQARINELVRSGASESERRDQLAKSQRRIRGVGQDLGFATGRTETYADRLNATPSHIQTDIRTHISGMAAAERALAIATRTRTAFIKPVVGSIGSIGGFLPGRQHGGPVEAGRPYVVGERRPELFVPQEDGTVMPRVPQGASAAGSGGGNVTVNVQGSVLSERDLVRVIRDEFTSGGFRGLT